MGIIEGIVMVFTLAAVLLLVYLAACGAVLPVAMIGFGLWVGLVYQSEKKRA